MHFTLQSTALSSLLLVLAHSALLSSVYAAPLNARADEYHGHIVDNQGNAVEPNDIKHRGLDIDKLIQDVFQEVLPDAQLDLGSDTPSISKDTAADKNNQMMYVEITGPDCNPCYLWSGRKSATSRARGGALLREGGPRGVENVHGKSLCPPRRMSKSDWKHLNTRVETEFEPVKRWIESAAGGGSAAGGSGVGSGRDPKMSLTHILN